MNSDSEYQTRIDHLQRQLAAQNVDAIAIAPTPNMRYLLGFAPIYDERFCALLVTQNDSRLVVPQVNADQADAHTGKPCIRWTDDEGPGPALRQALADLDLRTGMTLAADGLMQARHLLLLQAQAQPGRVENGELMMEPLRMCKSPAEIAALTKAAAQADRAILAGAEACKPGVAEWEIADVIAASLRAQGAQEVNFTIVASGPNGAFPHHHSGERRLQPGDTVIIDIGATLNGYQSDITRVVQLGAPSSQVAAVYAAVLEGNRAGREAVHPGIRAGAVDRAVRAPIERAGFGDLFFHRTGHGLGMEGHEPPWISRDSETVLQPGMVFSIEPGCYLPGEFGVRIEDIVVVTEDGMRCLTGLGRELIVRP